MINPIGLSKLVKNLDCENNPLDSRYKNDDLDHLQKITASIALEQKFMLLRRLLPEKDQALIVSIGKREY